MTVTVKLEALLEEQLRRHAAAAGLTTSDVIRSALQAYLDAPEAARAPSAFALGSDLFGRYSAEPTLAQGRKKALADIWSAKHDARGSR